MSIEEQNITESLCQEQGLDLRCINPRGQLWDNTHGDWFPGCVDGDTAPEASPYPKLPDFPRDEENCTEAAYEEFVLNNAAQYDHMVDLTNGGVLYWTVQDDDTINGMLSYDGLFGFLALGFAGPPGDGPPSLPGPSHDSSSPPPLIPRGGGGGGGGGGDDPDGSEGGSDSSSTASASSKKKEKKKVQSRSRSRSRDRSIRVTVEAQPLD